MQKKRIFNLPHKILEQIGAIADEYHIECYVVGGYVRDLLLKRYSKDIDIVCLGNGNGIRLANIVTERLCKKSKVSIYKNFGTAKVKLNKIDTEAQKETQELEDIEFVGARKESYRKNSRNPIVEDGTLYDDLRRRDFTINAMAISLNKQRGYGELIDLFNGIQDLTAEIIKTPLDPNITFSDDPLRILRGIRFATRFNFKIEENTFNSMKANVSRLEIVSMQRIINEINLSMLTVMPSKAFLLYLHSGVLKFVLPEMCNLLGKELRGKHTHKDNFYHTLQVLDNAATMSDNLWFRWAAILHDIAKPLTKSYHSKTGFSFHGHEDLGAKMIPQIFKRLSLPLGKEMQYVKKIVKLHLRPISLVTKDTTDSAFRRLLYDAGDDIYDLIDFCKADITSKNLDLSTQYLNNISRVEKRLKEVEERDRIKNFKLVITGEIIMKTFNVKPGKIIGEIKNAIKEAVLEGRIKNELSQATEYMIELAKEKGLL